LFQVVEWSACKLAGYAKCTFHCKQTLFIYLFILRYLKENWSFPKLSFGLFDLAPVVQKVDSAIHWINFCPVDNNLGFPNTYPLDNDLSSG